MGRRLARFVPPAHTDGDIFVYFPESDVLHLGDVFRTTSYPIIDKFNGGSLRGTIATLDRAIDLVGPDTKIIPGHGLEIEDRDKLIEFREMILEIRGRVYDMIREGMHLDEIMAAQPTASYDSTWEMTRGGLISILCRLCITNWGVLGGWKIADSSLIFKTVKI